MSAVEEELGHLHKRAFSSIPHPLMSLALHLPSIQNLPEDHLSGQFSDNHKWSVKDSVLQSIFCKWRYPSVDLFATGQKRSVKCSVPFWALSDSFLIPWTLGLIYAFP